MRTSKILSLILVVMMIIGVLPVVSSAVAIANADYFDFSDSSWIAENYGGVTDYNKSYTEEKPYFMAENSGVNVEFKTENGESFTRISKAQYPWLILRFPSLAAGKYMKIKFRPSVENTKVQFRWAYTSTTASMINYSIEDKTPDANGWYTAIVQVTAATHSSDKNSKYWGMLAPKGYFDIKLAELGDYFEEEKEISPITAAIVDGIDATVDFDNLTITAVAERDLTEETIGAVGEDNIEFTFYSDEEYADIVAGSEKIEKTSTSVISSVQYDVSAADGTITRWTVRKVSYGKILFDFTDSTWVTENNGGTIDESISYPDENPYFMGGNATSTITAVTENGETFARVTATKYPWIVLRFPGAKVGGYMKAVVRPSNVNTSVSTRWVCDNSDMTGFSLDELVPDENGWYTIVAPIPTSKVSKDYESNLFGIHTSNGYMDIKSAEYAESLDAVEEAVSPVSAATVDGINAFVDFENRIISADAENGLTPESIGTLSENDVNLTLVKDASAVCVENSAYIDKTIAYVSSNIVYNITNAAGNTTAWTVRKISRNGYIFDLTDTSWVKAHMSQELYETFNKNQLGESDPLIMPTNDSGILYTELKAIQNEKMPFLRVKLTDNTKYNWVVLRLDEIGEHRYVKYLYKTSSGIATPRWASGSGTTGGTTHISNEFLSSGEWSEYMGNIGSCNTHNNYDLSNKALAIHANKINFDLRYVACFDTQEEMEAFDPSVESATLGGVFGEVDNIAHTVIFDENAGDLNDVEFNLYTGSKLEKQGNAYTYPGGLTVQKYIATDFDGKKTVWTVQLGEGEAPQLMSISSDGTVVFDKCVGDKAKFAAIYDGEGKLIEILPVLENSAKLSIPQTTGEYTVKTFVWDSVLTAKPVSDALSKTVSFGNMVIFGDSYSTFQGHIPGGYDTWYTAGGHDNTDVTTVEETWWYQLSQLPGNNLLRNDSWSGTTICHTGYNGADCSEYSSFVYRLDKLISEGYFENNQVDTVFIFGGTNDTWAGSPVGEIKYENITKADCYATLPALSYMLAHLQEASPETRVVCLLNVALSNKIAEGYKEICDHYGAEYVQLYKLSRMGGHPSINGMVQIKDAILESVK